MAPKQKAEKLRVLAAIINKAVSFYTKEKL